MATYAFQEVERPCRVAGAKEARAASITESMWPASVARKRKAEEKEEAEGVIAAR